MVFIECCENYLVIASKSKISVFNSSNLEQLTDKFELKLPEFKLDKKNKSLLNNRTGNDDNPVCGKFSNDGSFFVVSDIYKRLIIWKTNVNSDSPNNDRSWEMKQILNTDKKVVQLCFLNDNGLLVGDKSCDVYKYNLETGECNLLFGHISMLLEMKICPQEKFILTCDRDEKIRVTNYPSVYNIQTFLLGHTEFVNTCTFINNNQVVSGSGDSTIKLWEIINGKELFSFDLNNCFSKSAVESGINANELLTNETSNETNGFKNESTEIKNRLAVKKVFYIQSNLVVTFFNLPNLVTFMVKEDKLILNEIAKLPSNILDAIEYNNQLYLLTLNGLISFKFKENQLRTVQNNFLTLINEDNQELLKFNENELTDFRFLYKFFNSAEFGDEYQEFQKKKKNDLF